MLVISEEAAGRGLKGEVNEELRNEWKKRR
jgi:hypothetical protein